MSIPDCVEELRQYIDGQSLHGENHDFSTFRITPTSWTNFKVGSQGHMLLLIIN